MLRQKPGHDKKIQNPLQTVNKLHGIMENAVSAFVPAKKQLHMTRYVLFPYGNISSRWALYPRGYKTRRRPSGICPRGHNDSFQIIYILESIALSEEATRVDRHDLKNHVTAMKDFLAKKAYAQLSQYLNDASHDVFREGAVVFNGNITVDSILNFKIKEAQSKDIQLSTEVAIPSGLKPLWKHSGLIRVLNQSMSSRSASMMFSFLILLTAYIMVTKMTKSTLNTLMPILAHGNTKWILSVPPRIIPL